MLSKTSSVFLDVTSLYHP